MSQNNNRKKTNNQKKKKNRPKGLASTVVQSRVQALAQAHPEKQYWDPN